MLELFASLLQFLQNLWGGILLALEINPRAFQLVETYPQSTSVIVTIVILAGMSQLMGQSVVLFVNRVAPVRFVASLMINGLLYVFTLLIWAAVIWLVGTWLFGVEQTFGVVFRIVSLGNAPLVFSFFILIPYLGMFISRLLYVWSLLIVLAGVGFTFQVGLGSALVCVGLGWLLMVVLESTIGRPIIALRNAIWHMVTGSRLETRVHDILNAFIEGHDDLPVRGGKI